MTNRDQPRYFSTPAGVVNSRGGLPVAMALGGARPLDALAWSFSDKNCPEVRFHLGGRMMNLRLRLTQELSAGLVTLRLARGTGTNGKLRLQSPVIV